MGYKKPAFAVMSTIVLLSGAFSFGEVVMAKSEESESVQEVKAEVTNVVSFTDVTKASYAFEAITYLASEGIIKGYGNGKYGLKDNVTRAQVSALIARYLDLDVDKKVNNPYSDVKGNLLEKDVLAVTDAGYMKGKGNGKFDPNGVLTRAEMAVVLTNVFDLKVKSEEDFWDLPKGHWAADSVRALYSNGITEGVGNNRYDLNGQVTREQYAEFLYRGIHLDETHVAKPIPPKEEAKDEKPDYTNAQGEMTRAGLARLIVESINPNVTASTSTIWDVKSGTHTEAYVQKAIALGFIKPEEYNGGFKATTAVSRSEVSTWLVNGLANNNAEYATIIKELQSDLTLLPVTEFLKGGIAKKDVSYVGIALGTGLLQGHGDSSFKPKGTINKASTDTVLNRYKNIVKKDPKSYSDLNEFREVALTGTNILSITRYVKE